MLVAGPTKPSWRAVGILPGREAGEAALALRGRRFLPAGVRRLPLPECTRQDQCSCKYQHYGDRRGAQRRNRVAGASDAGKAPERDRRRPGERRG
jgi:hypothetical protein